MMGKKLVDLIWNKVKKIDKILGTWDVGHAEKLLLSCVGSKVILCHVVTCHKSYVTCQMLVDR